MRFAIIWMIHLTWEHDSNLCSIIRTPYFVCKFQIAFLTLMHILNAKIERSASEISCFNNLSHVQFCVSMKHIGIQQLQNWLFSLFISIRIAAFLSIYICISPICRMKRDFDFLPTCTSNTYLCQLFNVRLQSEASHFFFNVSNLEKENKKSFTYEKKQSFEYTFRRGTHIVIQSVR